MTGVVLKEWNEHSYVKLVCKHMNTVNRLILSFGRRRLLPAVVPSSYPMAREADRLTTDGVAVDAVTGVTPVSSDSEG